MRYTPDSKQRVRDAVDMVDLVSARTELRRAGASRLTGLCPFHDERTPSFSVEPVEKVYFCFGCQAQGDLFTFVQETEGVDFREALELLAQRYGVELEPEDEDPRAAQRRQRRERLLELLERTAAFYVRHLWDAREAEGARAYLASRGLEEATLREFRVGYAPSAWDKVLLASRRAGFSEQEVMDAGLAQRGRGGGLYDRFRARITFPLADPRGRVLGFGARGLRDNQGPKYLNSAEGELFHKGRVVFAADLARAHAARAGQVVVAEGYTDVLALHQAGLRHSVGIMGTSVTEDQVGELARLAPTVLLALDADSAGQEAMLRAARVAAGRKLDLRVVALPPGSDPADLVQRDGPGEVRRLVDASVPFVRFRVERALAQGDLSGAEGKDRVLTELRPVFAELGPSVLREELLAVVAERMDLRGELVASLVGGGGAARAQAPAGPATEPPAPRAADPREGQERAFLAFCLARPDLGGPALAELDPDADLSHPVCRRVAVWLRDHLDAPTADLPGDAELAALVRELVVRAGRAVPTPAAFELQRLQLTLARLDREIVAARRSGGVVAALAGRRVEAKHRYDRAMERALEDQGSTTG
ncbi:MAG: DNA primase [Actinomycetota bacterium]|nr:DNA primase [Actinomycetota bacterium]